MISLPGATFVPKARKKMKKSFKESINKTGFVTLLITVAGKQYCFLVDTGSNQNSLSQTTYEEIGSAAKQVSRITIYGVDGIPNDELLVEVPYKCGKKEQKDLFFVMSGSAFEAMEEEYGVRLSGILGYSFLIRHKVKINYESMELILCD